MNEQNIPIDIHIGKLLDWLISRRIVQKNWHTKIPEIREKIGKAINDMPSHEDLVKLLSGTHIHYFHCLQIIEILKTTEADTKSVFGRYGSQRMKDWQEIVRLYEKDSNYLAEAGQILVRNVNYEIPGLKKQISKFDQLIDEAHKKIHDLTTSESVLTSQRAALCQKLGIEGKDLRTEFLAKINDLPKLYKDVVTNLSKVQQALNLYADFSKNPECLPTLRYVVKNGNTTVYEFLYGKAPKSIEEPPIQLKLTVVSQGNNAANEIDFGDNAIDFGNDAIDYGNEIDFSSDITVEQGGDIDWDDGGDAGVKSDIDFNISLEDSGAKGETDGVAKGATAYTILDSPTHRDQFIDELFELEAFLKMRLFELNSLENSNSASFLIIDGMDNYSSDSIASILTHVQQVLEKVTSELIQHLHQLKHSEKYADTLAGKLQQKVVAAEKMQATREVLKEKIETFKKDKLRLPPLVTKLTEQTKSLQNEIEQDVSKRYKNRPVNIMGGISLF